MSQVVNEHGLTEDEQVQHEVDYEAWCSRKVFDHVEQLRDIFYGRLTYDDDVEWVSNLKHSVIDLCVQTGCVTMDMRKDYSTKQKEIVMDYQQQANSDYKNNKPNIDDMRQDLAEREYDSLNDGTIIDILLEGCKGYNSMPEDEIREMYDSIFGEE